jgi:tyrosinase
MKVGLRRKGIETVRVRRDVKALGIDERNALVEALLTLKKTNRYDTYVHWHHHVMKPTVACYEPRDANYRNGAHRGPSFLPWHRELLMQVEADLQRIDTSLTMPYWNWAQDSEDPTSSAIWDDDFLGGDGVEVDGWRVATGPFAYARGQWDVPSYSDDELPGLKRQFAATVPTLPTQQDVQLALGESFYDTPHFNASPFTVGFRNRIEGFVTRRADHRVTTEGSQLHNRVHLWVGGSMLPMTSPNDPVFFLHHCFVDKIWADWQQRQREGNPDASPHYVPEQDGPAGHNIDDRLDPWEHTIRDVLDIDTLGYRYENLSGPTTHFVAEPSMAAATWSPFWAD